MIWLISACSSDSPSDQNNGTGELSLRTRMSGTIAREGEVDWYSFRAVETNTVLQVRCTSETLRPDVDLLVSVYELDESGKKVLLYADHAPDGGIQPADLTLNIYIDRPKDIYISVRDLMDDDASDNPYYISVDFASMPEGNENFTQATPLALNSDECPTDRIGHVGDVDCFTFDVTAGVYDLSVLFTPFPDTRVQLSADLYDDSGDLIGTQSSAAAQTYHMIHYLNGGRYYLQIDDVGRDDFDNASTYQVCLRSVEGVEGNTDDSRAQAQIMDLPLYNQAYTVEGALDYSEDQDWRLLSIPDNAIGFRVLNLHFSGVAGAAYQVDVVDRDGASLLSHVHQGGGNDYQTQIKLPDGDTYLSIRAADGRTLTASAAYTAILSVLDIDDPAEAAPNDNDSVNTADPLFPTTNPAAATQGKIGYRGDVDWYALTIPAHAQPQVLEVFVDAPLSQVAYTLSVMGTQLEKKLYNPRPDEVPTQLHTSILIPESDANAVYTFKVGDFQDDSGDNALYTIRADIRAIPTILPSIAAGAPPFGGAVTYCSEAAETDAHTVTLQYNSVTQKQFDVNTDALDFSAATVQTDTPSAGLTTLTFPWIGGYVDYQGDQDWFLIDFKPPADRFDTAWHYQIQVAFYAPATNVEYVWRFYPDRNDNRILADRSSDYDGFIASAGDGTLIPQAFSLNTPAAGEDMFWVGDAWNGPAYFSISDFNYLLNPDDRSENPDPDDDWGGYGTAPYYFRVTLIYHPGVSHP